MLLFTSPSDLSAFSTSQGSIVHSLAKVAVEADFQLLVSIYNPNALDAKIETGTAVFYHKHQQVSTRG